MGNSDRVKLFKVTKKELIEARKRLNLEHRGSDEEYLRNQLEEFYEFKPYRDRANTAMLD